MSTYRRWYATVLFLAAATAEAGGSPSTVYVSSTVLCDYPTIQAAINGVTPGSEIRLVGAEFALAAPVSVTNRTLRIAGGFPFCGAPLPTSRTALVAGFNGDPVMLVTGNVPGALDLTLVNLDLAEADNPAANGGGMRVTGTGNVSLFGVDVRDNFAMGGGGVAVLAFGAGPLTLSLGRGTRIGGDPAGGNGAEFGGGIYCDAATLRLGHAAIIGNAASGLGGGVRAIDCAIETFQEPGPTRIDGNRARRGGGIYASDALIDLASRPNQRVSISGNAAINGAAPRSGGGLYLAGNTVFETSGVRIDDNLARESGGGIFLAGATLRMDRGGDACLVHDDACSSVSGNTVRDAMGALAGHSAVAFVAGSGSPLLDLTQTRVVGNASAGALLRAGDAARIELTSTVFTGNTSNAGLIDNLSTAELRMDFVTLAGNTHVGAAVTNTSGAALAGEIRRSILMPAPGAATVVGTGTASFLCNNIAGGAHGGDAHDPGFINPAAGNYRLRRGSQNLDRCLVDGTEDLHDIGGRARATDDPEAANVGGILDRGAYEGSEGLLVDSFE